MKKGSLKSYLVLFLIMVGTIILTFYVLNLYKQYNDSKLSVPVISSVLREVNYNDLDNIVKERDFLVVYMCSSSESKCRNFENKFKDYIVKNNLSDDIVYLNIGYSSDENNVLDKIYSEYKHEDLIKKLYNYPSLVVFSGGKIIDLLSPSENITDINSLVEEFLEGYEL